MIKEKGNEGFVCNFYFISFRSGFNKKNNEDPFQMMFSFILISMTIIHGKRPHSISHYANVQKYLCKNESQFKEKFSCFDVGFSVV
jgi:hypothetical protein